MSVSALLPNHRVGHVPVPLASSSVASPARLHWDRVSSAALSAPCRAVESGEAAGSFTWFCTEFADYWPRRASLPAVLRYHAGIEIDHWREDDDTARVVAGAVENEHVWRFSERWRRN